MFTLTLLKPQYSLIFCCDLKKSSTLYNVLTKSSSEQCPSSMASFSAEFSNTSNMQGPRAKADGTASDYCPLQWWKLNSIHLPM